MPVPQIYRAKVNSSVATLRHETHLPGSVVAATQPGFAVEEAPAVSCRVSHKRKAAAEFVLRRGC